MKKKILLMFIIFISTFAVGSKNVYADKWECYYQNPDDPYLLSVKGVFNLKTSNHNDVYINAIDGIVIKPTKKNIDNFFHDKKVDGYKIPEYYKNAKEMVENSCPDVLVGMKQGKSKYHVYAFHRMADASSFVLAQEEKNKNKEPEKQNKFYYATRVSKEDYDKDNIESNSEKYGYATKECYYSDENSMIRLVLKNPIDEKELEIGASMQYDKQYKAYLDVLNSKAIIENDYIGNYISDDRFVTWKTKETKLPCYMCGGSGRGNASTIQASCPEVMAVVDTKKQIRYTYWAFKESDYDKIENYLEQLKSSGAIRGYALNSTQVDKETYYALNSSIYSGNDTELKGCDLIDEDVKGLINEILTYIAIIVPIAIIGISSYELAKAMGKSKEDEMKKAQKHLIIRILVSLLIFLTPTIINIIFNITENLWQNSELYTCDINGKEMGNNNSSDNNSDSSENNTNKKSCYSCTESSNSVYRWELNSIYGNNENCSKTTYTEKECMAMSNFESEKSCYSCGDLQNPIYHWGLNSIYKNNQNCFKTTYTEKECITNSNFKLSEYCYYCDNSQYYWGIETKYGARDNCQITNYTKDNCVNTNTNNNSNDSKLRE